ncbi:MULTISPECIES: DUF817 domain-containing protein [unclassified Curtobacterium]|uniref:DUF817 domain-containing protein n=1 Tax=unclassified Curtobacterium TaxID=257496 RepID=UPI000F48D636|nr:MULTISPECIES: DUF817 domain-containing protein [unclassified Curtobacterium]ROQ05142.1 uncharacterized membrane protein YoaT (DUF817 family) [Curtobacterium sp. PhB171]ROQ22343.1 uncharacterized membrane protein YoaT (DUF817 family) [Curtobacterium sp. PhB170]ROS33703.1 uncharacterized membrane protein YoaT (DUF817 family) [Curtobacterium sp. PhB131]ROS65022.1 uncharacterized membrane protein YoaT (DUF817 family) [Curtobacterium sp. PhB141]
MTVRALSTAVEARIDRAARRLLDAGHQPHRPVRLFVTEFLVFGAKQAWACAFGALLLGSMAVASVTVPATFRNDVLTVVAVLLQVGMLVFGLETVRELRVVLLFHVVGTAMEVFKTHMGSWSYEPGGLFVIAGVPLFSGFMYGAVGSYMVRVHRLFDLRFDRYPRQWLLAVVAAGVYLNFFGHHFLPDARWVLLALVVLLFARTTMHVRIHRATMRMPVLVAMGLVAVFIWFAENVATWAGAWSYPAQLAVWHPVAPTKIVAWFLLMTISVALVTWLYPALPSSSARWTADSRRLRGARAAGAHSDRSSTGPEWKP